MGEKGSQGVNDQNGNGKVDEGDKVDENTTFIGLLDDQFKIPNSNQYQAAGTNLVSGAEMFFGLLQMNSEMQNLEELMRYALNIYTGNDYGVTSLDLSIYNIKDFTKKEINANRIAEVIKSYGNESLRLFMNGKASNYTSVQAYVTEDKTQYKLYKTTDGSIKISYNIVLRDSDGELNYETYFSEEELDLKALIEKLDSGEEVCVEVEKVDRIFESIIKDKKEQIKSVMEYKNISLKSYELDALTQVAVEYDNCGQYINDDMNIATLYKNYYEKGEIETFKQNAQVETDEGERIYMFTGSDNAQRKERNWNLFTDGKYILSDGTELKGGAEVVDFALQFVGENHSRFTSYNPDNGVSDIWYGADWCAMFVSYCYNECGLIPEILPNPFAGCDMIYTLYSNGNSRAKIVGDRGIFAGVPKDDYTPSPGDIIFFNWGSATYASHTGIVVSCDGVNVHTIEGNNGGGGWTGSKVSEVTYSLNSASIVGYISINDD